MLDTVLVKDIYEELMNSGRKSDVTIVIKMLLN